MSAALSRTGTSNGRGDAARPKSIRKVTRPVSATAPPGRRPAAMIHRAKPREPSSAIDASAGSGGPASKAADAAAAATLPTRLPSNRIRSWARPAAGSSADRKVTSPSSAGKASAVGSAR